MPRAKKFKDIPKFMDKSTILWSNPREEKITKSFRLQPQQIERFDKIKADYGLNVWQVTEMLLQVFERSTWED